MPISLLCTETLPKQNEIHDTKDTQRKRRLREAFRGPLYPLCPELVATPRTLVSTHSYLSETLVGGAISIVFEIDKGKTKIAGNRMVSRKSILRK